MDCRLTHALLLHRLAVVLTSAPSGWLGASAARAVQTRGSAPQGFRSPSLRIAQYSVACTSNGLPVIWEARYDLNDVGMTIPTGQWTRVAYNPEALNAMESDRVKLFWLGHECGHAYLRTRDETAADCWSATTGCGNDGLTNRTPTIWSRC